VAVYQKHPIEGQSYIFCALLKYAKKHDRQPVQVKWAGELCSVVIREDSGFQFAAMNDELVRETPEQAEWKEKKRQEREQWNKSKPWNPNDESEGDWASQD
jgi:hypothetical protein